MKESVTTLKGLVAGFEDMTTQVLEYLPRVAVAVLVLVIGWLLARLLRLVLERSVVRLDKFWQKLESERGLTAIKSRNPPTRIIGILVFWLILLIFITMAADILGLNIFGTWLKEIFTYLPLAAAGLFIVLVGFVVSSLARDLMASAAASAGLSHGDLLARTTQIIILFIAIILGIDQIGIDIIFLTVMAGIVLATMLGGIALAFGLGARTHVSNIIAANQMRQVYQVGDRVRVGDIEGKIMDLMVARVIIETESGTVDVPAKIFDEQVTMVIEKGS